MKKITGSSMNEISSKKKPPPARKPKESDIRSKSLSVDINDRSRNTKMALERSKAVSLPETPQTPETHFLSKRSHEPVKHMCEKFLGSSRESMCTDDDAVHDPIATSARLSVQYNKDLSGKPVYPSMGMAAEHRKRSSRSSSSTSDAHVDNMPVPTTGIRVADEPVSRGAVAVPLKTLKRAETVKCEVEEKENSVDKQAECKRRSSLPIKVTLYTRDMGVKDPVKKAVNGNNGQVTSSSLDDSYEYDDVFVPYSEEDKVNRSNTVTASNKPQGNVLTRQRSVSLHSLSSFNASSLDDKLQKSMETAIKSFYLMPTIEISDTDSVVIKAQPPPAPVYKSEYYINKKMLNIGGGNSAERISQSKRPNVPLVIHDSDSSSDAFTSDYELKSCKVDKPCSKSSSQVAAQSSVEDSLTNTVCNTSTIDSGADISATDTTDTPQHTSVTAPSTHQPDDITSSSDCNYTHHLILQQTAKISSKSVRCLVVDGCLSTQRFDTSDVRVISCSGGIRDPEPVLKWQRLPNEEVWSNEPIYEMCPRTKEIKYKEFLPKSVQEQCFKQELERKQSGAGERQVSPREPVHVGADSPRKVIRKDSPRSRSRAVGGTHQKVNASAAGGAVVAAPVKQAEGTEDSDGARLRNDSASSALSTHSMEANQGQVLAGAGRNYSQGDSGISVGR